MSVVKELESQRPGQQSTLVKGKSGKYYVVSSVSMSMGFELGVDETMIFPGNKEPDKEGSHVDSFGDLWCCKPRDHEAGIEAAKEETDFYD